MHTMLASEQQLAPARDLVLRRYSETFSREFAERAADSIDDRLPLLVAIAGDDVIATTQLVPLDPFDEGSALAFERAFGRSSKWRCALRLGTVAKEWQRQGLHKLLVHLAIEAAKRTICGGIVAVVENHPERLQMFLDRGFEVTATGRLEDDIVNDGGDARIELDCESFDSAMAIGFEEVRAVAGRFTWHGPPVESHAALAPWTGTGPPQSGLRKARSARRRRADERRRRGNDRRRASED